MIGAIDRIPIVVRQRRIIVALLSSAEAAAFLGIERTTLYCWLSQSNVGQFSIRGHKTTIGYFQGGRRGQGRIQIEQQELDRLLQLMRVEPKRVVPRRQPTHRKPYQHISVTPGRPDE